MKYAVFVFLIFQISGCTNQSHTDEPVTPVSYEPTQYRRDNSIGHLRRLALMPVELEAYEGKYSSLEGQKTAALNYQDLFEFVLTEDKGYEIVKIKDTDGMWQNDVFEISENSNMRNLQKIWQTEGAGKHSASLIRELGTALNVDGILVIWIQESKPWGAAMGVLNIMLLNIPLFYQLSSPDVGAWIYETATGRLVWSMEQSTFGNSNGGVASIRNILGELDNAVPRQLIDSIPP